MRLITVITAVVGRLFAQNVNLVNNPSFELTLPVDTAGGWDKALYWSAIDSTDCAAYILATKKGGTVPYFVGFQWPRSGENYVASTFYCDQSTCPSSDRLYPRNRLKLPLKPNTKYCAKYFIVNTNNCVVGIDSYGALFEGSILDTNKTCLVPMTSYVPQIEYIGGIVADTLKWVPITGTFVATGGEKYMVLGNFRSNAVTNTAVINPTFLPTLATDILIDDVSLIEYDLPAYAGRDTSIAPGDSVFLGRLPEPGLDELCTWYKPPSTVPVDTIAGFWVNPLTTSTYVVRQEICGLVKWDTVVIYMDMVGMRHEDALLGQVKIWPSPASHTFRIAPAYPGSLSSFSSYRMYSTTGVTATEGVLHESGNEIDVNGLPNGLYFLEITGSYQLNRRVIVSHQ